MNQEPTCGLYADPKIYDILYTPDTWRELDVLERIESEFAINSGGTLEPDRLWLEPACGSGRYLRTAAKRGRRITGFDLDPAMLDYAQKRCSLPGHPLPVLFSADMADFLPAARAAGVEPNSVDFAFNPVNSIRHLQTDEEILSHFEQIASLLRPGALYVVGISLTDYSELLPEEDFWVGTRGRCRVSQTVNYLPPKTGLQGDNKPGSKLTRDQQVERVISHLVVERPGGNEHFDHAYDLRCYDQGQWTSLIENSALNLVGSCDARGRAAPDFLLPYQLHLLS